MKLPNSKIEKATAHKSDLRPHLRAPFLDVAKKRLIATDGHILAIVPAEPHDGDTSGLIPVEALLAARKSKMHVLATGLGATVPDGATYHRPAFTYPDVDKAMPPKPDRPCDICLNATTLLQLATALTEGRHASIKIWLGETPREPLYVEPLVGAGVGCIMPIFLKDGGS